ncbi:hypothetical protein WJX72_001374 [[Myrmecia] bisecta]|uniref:Uncharacterized protein n=1 Tax=[Myrmecia] bisecta TaxID=41462 RepID=A0AAW1QA68_9CHLO
MMQSRPRSYRTELAKRQAYDKMMQHMVGAENICPDKLMTDRASYISYLESQLERITSACLTMQSFDERIESATSSARGLEEKVLNVARLIKCTQSYAEEHEGLQKRAIASLAQRLQRLETAGFPITGPRDSQLALEASAAPSPWTPAQEQFIQAKLDEIESRVESRLAERLQGLEEAVANLASKEELQRSLECIQMLEGMQGVFQKEVDALGSERAQFTTAIEALKADAAQAHASHQSLAVQMLESVERTVDAEVRKGMQSLARAEGHVQSLAGDMRRSAQEALTSLSPARSARSDGLRADHHRAGQPTPDYPRPPDGPVTSRLPSPSRDGRDGAKGLDAPRMPFTVAAPPRDGRDAAKVSDTLRMPFTAAGNGMAPCGNPGSPVHGAAENTSQRNGLWGSPPSPSYSPWRQAGGAQPSSPSRRAAGTAAVEAELQQQMADVQGTMSGVQSSFSAMRGALQSMHEALAHDADVSKQLKDRKGSRERLAGSSGRSLLSQRSPQKAAGRPSPSPRGSSRRLQSTDGERVPAGAAGYRGRVLAVGCFCWAMTDMAFKREGQL